ncbi:hypothetical protein K2173_026798 [Erythroxylum novogranatense]|uniref:FLZ-type domain-containing protein n=1 Tax=Erythroxylum novogranatense TaxID=1862640 RepID=A0AAV8TX94_9ROSI|nr:hypothetical protein K2173_026798 [Erythroxylum novogranatense]
MLLGKRPRHPMKRTTSMSEITFDLDTTDTTETNNPASDFFLNQRQPPTAFGDQRFLASTVSPRNHRRTSADFLETAQFLRACFLCKRRLTPGRDIYMYRGDSAFCSLECRQQQMNQDERKEKCSRASNKEAVPSNATDISTKGETVAAL